MSEVHVNKIAEELNIAAKQVNATAKLFSEGATVPFISRYRKEVTGGLDEVVITNIRDRLEQLKELDKRRDAILKSLKEQGKLTEELKEKVMAAATMTALEDIYLPYRPKRRTRGKIAREKGLEPLAKVVFEQGETDPLSEAAKFIDKEKGVESVEEALAGARDIIAEWVNEDAQARKKVRDLFAENGVLSSKVIKGKEIEGAKYKDYFEWEEPIKNVASHRMLAIRRGADEGILILHILPEEEDALLILRRNFIKGRGSCSEEVEKALQDCYKRLLGPSMETGIRLESRKRAEEKAIAVFAANLRELLLASPLGQKNMLAVDPGLRTGCKIVCLDRQGKLLVNDTIFPLAPFNKVEESANKIKKLCERFDVEAISVGNGTGGREAEAFLKAIDFSRPVSIVVVNESGASVYSASKIAREEFPDHDVTVRGAVSIGRRLMDPLAELVKIDPKSIGVGQYQHDVDQKELKKSLDDVVESCVNSVGAEVNTASKQLLSYISGLGPKVAEAIVSYRNEKGPFKTRKEFLKIPGMGPKTFEQAAGFLRIREGNNPLDTSGVHPESYKIVEKMARDLKSNVRDLVKKSDLRSRIDLTRYVTEKAGLPTLKDIMLELEKPGRDPRKEFEAFAFDEKVHEPKDLEVGMTLPGIVTNVTGFGAFVDIGVHLDGLVHISQLADKFVKNPSDIVKVQQKVNVTVLEIDLERKRISLSMKKDSGLSETGGGSTRRKKQEQPGKKPKPGSRSRPQAAGNSSSGKPGSGKDFQREQVAGNNPFADFFDKRK